jgi:preprotein translocase subunit SecY
LPHSVYIAVVGGVNSDIAQTIWTKINTGCNYNGNTSVVVTDTSYTSPHPSYTIKFNRPSMLPVLFAVSIVSSPSLPSDIVDQIKAAIISRFNGQDGTSRERIAGIIYASRYYSAVASLGNIAIISILIGTITPILPSINIGIDQMPTLTESDIAVTLV